MKTLQIIQSKLIKKFSPVILKIDDVSYLHKSHKEMISNSHSDQTHFNLLIVSENFKDLSSIARHRLIYALLEEEIKDCIHALAIKAYTTKEYQNLVSKL